MREQEVCESVDEEVFTYYPAVKERFSLAFLGMHLIRHIPQRCMAFSVAVIAALCFLIPQTHAYYNNMPASVVIGQRDFTSGDANQGGNTAANTLNSPRGVYYDASSQKLFIADSLNNRVLIFNSLPGSSNPSADVVIGQPNFVSNAANQGGSPAANTLSNSARIVVRDGRLFIADSGNRRVLIYNSIPETNNASADVVVGQPDFTSNAANQGDAANPKANTLSGGETGVASDGQKLYIADTGNNRILIFNSIPTTNNASADVVLGQTDFTTRVANQGGIGAATLDTPIGLLVADNKLLVGDIQNFRVLVWNTIPTTNKAPADVVIGQPNFTSNGSQSFGVNVRRPFDFAYDGKRLFIVHDFSAVVSIRNNGIPTTNFTPHDITLGTLNTTTLDAAHLWEPRSITLAEDRLIVADSLHYHRVLIFENTLPDVSLSRTITGQPNGKLRFTGTASTNVTNQIIKRIEYSVNGSTWTGGFPTDGHFDSASEPYYFDFDPSFNTMADDQGYTVKIRSTHDNDKDTGTSTLYFEPFLAKSPLNNAFTLNRLPTFTFTIQKFRFSDLKENLDHFRVMVKREGGDWQQYMDFIPVDYNSVRLHADNLNPNQVDTMNGTYEDKFKIVTYDQDNSVITVSPKAVDSQGKPSDKFWEDGGRLLSNATYEWKIQAEDHAGQLQETDPRTIRIGTRQVVTSRPYFLLSIYAISGIPGYFDISTNHPDDAPKTLTMTTDNPKFAPTFAGHAFAGSTVTFATTDDTLATSAACLAATPDPRCTQTYQTTVKPDSSFRYTIPKAFRPGNSYDVTVSVKDTGDNYNELPTFTVQVQAM